MFVTFYSVIVAFCNQQYLLFTVKFVLFTQLFHIHVCINKSVLPTFYNFLFLQLRKFRSHGEKNRNKRLRLRPLRPSEYGSEKKMAEVTNEAELLKEKANKFFKGKSQDLSSLGFITGDSHRLPRHNYLFFCSNLTSFPLNRSRVQMLRRANAHFKLHSFEQRLAVSSVAVSVFW